MKNKTDIFDRIDRLTARPFTDCERAGRFLGCTGRTVRRMVSAGELGAIRRTPTSPYQVLTSALAASMVRSLWEASLDGQRLPGIDTDRLERYFERFCGADAVQ